MEDVLHDNGMIPSILVCPFQQQSGNFSALGNQKRSRCDLAGEFFRKGILLSGVGFRHCVMEPLSQAEAFEGRQSNNYGLVISLSPTVMNHTKNYHVAAQMSINWATRRRIGPPTEVHTSIDCNLLRAE